MQYIYEDQYRGKLRKLVIFPPNEGQEYRVFCETNFIGSITPVSGDNNTLIWKTAYDILKPLARKLGVMIEGFQDDTCCTP